MLTIIPQAEMKTTVSNTTDLLKLYFGIAKFTDLQYY